MEIEQSEKHHSVDGKTQDVEDSPIMGEMVNWSSNPTMATIQGNYRKGGTRRSHER